MRSAGDEDFAEEADKSRDQQDHAKDKKTGNNECYVNIHQASREQDNNDETNHQRTQGGKVDGQINKSTAI